MVVWVVTFARMDRLFEDPADRSRRRRRGARRVRWFAWLGVAAVGCLGLAGCSIPGVGSGETSSTTALAPYVTAPTPTAAVAGSGSVVADADGQLVSGTVGEWRCGEVKEAVYRHIAIMSVFADSLEAPPAEPAEGDVWTAEELRDAMRASAAGFTDSDQAALNSACELFGQHASAWSLWAAGDRGDACDVWLPAHESAAETSFEIAVLHPLVAHMWVSATGAVAEGNGRCIAERAN